VFESVREMKPLGVGINLQPNAVRELYDLGITEGELDEVGVPAKEWVAGRSERQRHLLGDAPALAIPGALVERRANLHAHAEFKLEGWRHLSVGVEAFLLIYQCVEIRRVAAGARSVTRSTAAHRGDSSRPACIY
jgi:hypothetical protein